VEIEIAPIEKGTKLILSHTCEQDGVLSKEHLDGWTHFLGNLKSVLETGRDQRAFTRPMLGVYIDGLIDQELAEKLGMSEVLGVAIS
ncbi:MAG: hypothetical protein GWN00_22565, partial [Aliifodinibius sp.]|nr:hypothetical protein [Fodinibius sp.]NIW46586.1 hypothetical protein [Gammaproteobacteria bacterium]NIY27484.1 hypothetical protein [Fodinibius sp.]